MSFTQARNHVFTLAPTQNARALVLAQRIASPWYRAQALAAVAQHAPTRTDALRIAHKALDAAGEGSDAYVRVAGAAWPARILIARNAVDKLNLLLPRLIADTATLANPLNRVDALKHLWAAVWQVQGAREPVQEALIAACAETQHWKVGVALQAMVLALAARDRDEAERVYDVMPEDRRKRQTRRLLDQGTRLQADDYLSRM